MPFCFAVAFVVDFKLPISESAQQNGRKKKTACVTNVLLACFVMLFT